MGLTTVAILTDLTLNNRYRYSNNKYRFCHSCCCSGSGSLKSKLGKKKNMDQVKTEPDEIHLVESPLYVGELYMDIVKEDTEICLPSDDVEDVTECEVVLQPVDDEASGSSKDDLLNISYSMMGPPKVCSNCNEAWQPELTQHKCRFSDGLIHQCAICPQKFKFKQNLKQHEKSHLDSFNFKICAECGLACKNVYALMQHMRQHQADSRFAVNYKCEYCAKGFARKSQLDSHVRLEHQCSVCFENFKYKEELVQHKKLHLKRSHTHMRSPATCSDLSSVPQTRDQLKTKNLVAATMTSTRTNEGPRQLYSCEICLKMFASKPKLTQHISCHKWRDGFVCPLCFRYASTYSRLKSHVVVHKLIKKKGK